MTNFLWGLMSDPEYRFNRGAIAPAFRSQFEEAVAHLVSGGRSNFG